jgi:hypothetical protein
MDITADAKTESLDQLLNRLNELERRVSRLELPGESHYARQDEREVGKSTEQTPIQIYEEGTVSSSWVSRTAGAAESESAQGVVPATALDSAAVGSVVSSLAKAVLGLAGAYLLRAGAGSGWLPHSAAILTAFAYALTWLIAAGKTTNRAPTSSTIYALVSSMMFLGLVWENEARSALLPPSIAALLIVVYLCAGQVVAWLRDRREIAAAMTASTVALSLALFVVTHNLIPFNISLLSAAAVSEFAASRGRWLGQRWMAALGADFAILITSWIFSQSPTLPAGYAPFSQSSVLGIQFVLVLVYLASMSYRTLATRTVVTAFEMVQNVVATGLLVLGQIVLASPSRQRLLIGVICFIIALGSYTGSIYLADKRARRNSWAYGLFGLALQITAILTVVPPYARPVTLCVLGVGAAWLGNRERQTGLRWHAPVYLFAAALACGLVRISGQSLTNLNIPRPDHLIAMLITAASVALVYALVGSGQAGNPRVPPLFCAGLLAWIALGLGAIAIQAVFGGVFFATSLRVALICLVAVGTARWGILNRAADGPEWVWISCPLMLYGAWRIVVEDLPSGRPAASALSLLFYGGALLLLTRMLRPPHPGLKPFSQPCSGLPPVPARARARTDVRHGGPSQG